MTTTIAIDLSGLSWRNRTGVQNLYWAYANAWAENPTFHSDLEVFFYYRSGIYNHNLQSIVGLAYQSLVPSWWPDQLRRLLQVLIKSVVWRMTKLSGAIPLILIWAVASLMLRFRSLRSSWPRVNFAMFIFAASFESRLTISSTYY
jgi:hypothetical protein